MHINVSITGSFVALFGACALAQNVSAPTQGGPQPLYEVTVVSRTTKAINYGYLSAPTRIGFQGTAVASTAHGSGIVEPTRGSTLLNLRFEDLPAPSRFGPQFLTYVVWTISPDGRPQNIGEIVLEGSDKGRLKTSTPLQTFALIVTAEPYYAVNRPSGVVVMENVVTRDTIGKIQEVRATYELLPKQPYTFDTSAAKAAPASQLVSPEEHESLSALYQALNAIQIAQSQGADTYAREQMTRAREIYNRARTYPVHLSKEIVSMAREATQIAEDSRAIAMKRAELGTAVEPPKVAVVPARQHATNPAPPPTQQQARARTEPAASSAEPAPRVETSVTAAPLSARARQNRDQLLAGLPRYFEVLDSERGVTIMIPEVSALTPEAESYFYATAVAMKPYKGLQVAVEAHSNQASVADTERTAMKVREALINAGIAPEAITARGYGNTRPRPASSSASSATQSGRVEVTISGEAIGGSPGVRP